METLKPDQILRGYDGALYHEGKLLLEVNEFTASITISNTDYQPAKSRIVVGITTGYSVGITFSEAVIRDGVLLKKLFDHIRGDSSDIAFDFIGELEGHDGTASRQVFRSCEPDGTIDVLSWSQGDIVRRGWSFRCNEAPDLQDQLGAA